MKLESTMLPTSKKSFVVSAMRRMFSCRASSLKPRSQQSPRERYRCPARRPDGLFEELLLKRLVVYLADDQEPAVPMRPT